MNGSDKLCSDIFKQASHYKNHPSFLCYRSFDIWLAFKPAGRKPFSPSGEQRRRCRWFPRCQQCWCQQCWRSRESRTKSCSRCEPTSIRQYLSKSLTTKPRWPKATSIEWRNSGPHQPRELVMVMLLYSCSHYSNHAMMRQCDSWA